jgi:hypothetical protein
MAGLHPSYPGNDRHAMMSPDLISGCGILEDIWLSLGVIGKCI